jgi:hypothetical protein
MSSDTYAPAGASPSGAVPGFASTPHNTPVP